MTTGCFSCHKHTRPCCTLRSLTVIDCVGCCPQLGVSGWSEARGSRSYSARTTKAIAHKLDVLTGTKVTHIGCVCTKEWLSVFLVYCASPCVAIHGMVWTTAPREQLGGVAKKKKATENHIPDLSMLVQKAACHAA